MPVFVPGTWLNPESRPDGCGISTAGRFAVPVEGGRFDRHFHEDDELWFFTEGKGRILTDGQLQYVQAGDIVLTSAGEEHDIVEVYETLRGFFTETGVPTPTKVGHLHSSEEAAAGHEVPALPVPADFPVRG